MDCASLQTPVVCGTLRVTNGRAVCPICGRLTAQRILPDTRLTRFPLFCKRCKGTAIVNLEPVPESPCH